MSKSKMENLPLEWVRVFEAAGRLGSFTKAAEECGLTQAAVSQRIRNLEMRIGAALFSRQARGVILTVEGEAWLPYVSNALQTVHHSAADLFGKPIKNLTISASTSITQLWIMPRLGGFQAGSGFQISVTTMNVQGDFAKAKAMLEIRYGSGQWPELRKAQLYPEALTPMAAPGLLQGCENWQALPRIALSGPRPGWQEWAALSGDTPAPAPDLRFDTFVSALAAAKAGLGVLLGSVPLCQGDLDDKTLIRLSDDTLNPGSGYWLTASETLGQKQWDGFVKSLCA